MHCSVLVGSMVIVMLSGLERMQVVCLITVDGIVINSAELIMHYLVLVVSMENVMPSGAVPIQAES